MTKSYQILEIGEGYTNNYNSFSLHLPPHQVLNLALYMLSHLTDITNIRGGYYSYLPLADEETEKLGNLPRSHGKK